MSAVQPSILNALESSNILQNGYNEYCSCRYICSKDKRFLYELCSWNCTITINDTYTGRFRTINGNVPIVNEWWPNYYLDNENRFFCFNQRQGVYYRTVLSIDSTFTSFKIQSTPLKPRDWGILPVKFLATDKSNLFVFLQIKGNPVEENHFFWFDTITEDVRPIGRHVDFEAGAFSLGSQHQFYKGKIYSFMTEPSLRTLVGFSVADLTPEIIPSDPNELPQLKWKKLDIKEIKPFHYMSSKLLVESDYLYAILQQQSMLSVDCSLLIVYDLLNDKYTTCLLKSTFTSRPIAMALDGGVLTVHKKKRSRTNGQHITTFRYTLRKPETLTMLAWICSQKLNVVDLPPFSIRSPSSIRSPFPPQKCRSKRPASVSF